MIVKSRLYHKVGLPAYILHWLVRAYNAIPSMLFRPVNQNIRCFMVVGCGHSGTSLMAAKLSNHPGILGIGRETGVMLPGKYPRHVMKAITDEWSYFAEAFGYQYVLEKTPKHLYAYDAVQSVVPNNKFLVMVRNPLDNIASLYKRFDDLDYAVERWVLDNKEALRISENGNVHLVRYETFTHEPETTMRAISSFFEIEYCSEMLEGTGSIYDGVKQIENMQLRQEQVSKPVKPNQGGWRKVFSEEEARAILARLGNLPSDLGYDVQDMV